MTELEVLAELDRLKEEYGSLVAAHVALVLSVEDHREWNISQIAGRVGIGRNRARTILQSRL